jgi:hypothetical protein
VSTFTRKIKQQCDREVEATMMTNKTFDFSFSFHDMTAFSPPAESWIIQYPKKDAQEMRKPIRVPEAAQLENPCRQYIESSEIPVKSNKVRIKIETVFTVIAYF